jgi:hypothetical protein
MTDAHRNTAHRRKSKPGLAFHIFESLKSTFRAHNHFEQAHADFVIVWDLAQGAHVKSLRAFYLAQLGALGLACEEIKNDKSRLASDSVVVDTVSASYELLCATTERMATPFALVGGGSLPFDASNLDAFKAFAGRERSRAAFSSSQRQRCVLHLLHSVRPPRGASAAAPAAVPPSGTIASDSDPTRNTRLDSKKEAPPTSTAATAGPVSHRPVLVKRLSLSDMMHVLASPSPTAAALTGGDQNAASTGAHTLGESLLNRLVFEGAVRDLYPLHDVACSASLLGDWVRKPGDDAVLGRMGDYFGTSIAWYAAWVASFTNWLMAPALFGMCIWFFQTEERRDLSSVLYAIMVPIWSTLFTEFWKRRQSVLGYRFGTLDYEAKEEPRLEFEGELRTSAITGRPELYYSSTKRRLKYLVSLPVSLALVAFFVALVIFLFRVEAYVKREFSSVPLLLHVPTILYSLSLPTCNALCSTVARRLTEWENHRTTSDFNASLVPKLVAFQFVASYMSLFYIMFYLGDMERLQTQLRTLFLTNFLIGNLKEVAIPVLKERIRVALAAKKAADRKCDDGDSSELAPEASESQIDHEGLLEAYEGTFEEYIEIVIQFGHIALFGFCWPLCPLFAVLNNMIEVWFRLGQCAACSFLLFTRALCLFPVSLCFSLSFRGCNADPL